MIQTPTISSSLLRSTSQSWRTRSVQCRRAQVALLHTYPQHNYNITRIRDDKEQSYFSCHQQQRPFSTTPRYRDDQPKPTHYEVLGVPNNATPAELKKKFYALSRETHPDLNRSDPKAGERFSQISESYTILADPKKRERYDRDVMRTHPSNRRNAGAAGSYAGSRPASGLSKRRNAFRGPPPSYYAHGGSKPGASSSTEGFGPEGPSTAENLGGQYTMGQDYDGSPFSTASVYRTQTFEDVRRKDRRAAALAAAQAEVEDYDSNFWARFVIVGGIVVLGVSLGTLVVGMGVNGPRGSGPSLSSSGKGPPGGLVRGDGSRRGEPKNDWTKG